MVNLSLVLLPPTVNISPVAHLLLTTPSRLTPVIHIACSNLISPTAVPLATVPNGNELLLSTAAVEAKTAGQAHASQFRPTVHECTSDKPCHGVHNENSTGQRG